MLLLASEWINWGSLFLSWQRKASLRIYQISQIGKKYQKRYKHQTKHFELPVIALSITSFRMNLFVTLHLLILKSETLLSRIVWLQLLDEKSSRSSYISSSSSPLFCVFVGKLLKRLCVLIGNVIMICLFYLS